VGRLALFLRQGLQLAHLRPPMNAAPMRLILRSAVREHPGDLVVHEARWLGAVVWALFSALSLAWCVAPLVWGWKASFGLAIGLPCAAVAALMYRGVARAWTSRWWIVRAHRSGLVISLRSALNRDLPVEWGNVVQLERHDVRRVVAERSDERGSVLQLSFELSTPVPPEVQRSLERELDPRMSARTHFNVQLVCVERPDVLSLVWSGGSARLAPGLRGTLRELERLGYPVEREVRRVSPTRTQLGAEEREARVGELARSGEKIEAIRLWREVHGGSLLEAKQAIERLAARDAA
jgi:hypothetical protein